MKYFLIVLILSVAQDTLGQYNWQWEELPSMPESISNNAVTHGMIGDEMYVYSFSGIDSTKTNDGISLNSFRYSMASGNWENIPDLPDSLGKIAASASTVDNMIYIIGGYHVFDESPFELSSDRVHRYDPETNSYLEDGVSIPFAIDDQVQVVWRDSLIFVVTGWSNTQNVEYVQIYDPQSDEWTQGTPVPNGSIYEAFGASGTIVGDTIFYYGGAVGFNFSASGRLRKGVINPDDPTQITWTELGASPGPKGYRAASLTADDKAFWIGGSGVTYNFNGIAYNGSGGVEPLNRILGFDPLDQQWGDMLGQPFGIMDLRGVAQVGVDQFVICGGMESDQIVTDRAFLLTYGGPSSVFDSETPSFQVYPNPLQIDGLLAISSTRPFETELHVLDCNSKLIAHLTVYPGYNQLTNSQIGIDKAGIYLLKENESDRSIRLIVR